MKTEIEIRKHIQSLLEGLKSAQKNYDRHKINRLNEQITTLYWVLGESYTVPSMNDVTLNYDNFRQLSPHDMAMFLCFDEDGEPRSSCATCAAFGSCHDKCISGVTDWLTRSTTTDDWVKLLKQKGIWNGR